MPKNIQQFLTNTELFLKRAHRQHKILLCREPSHLHLDCRRICKISCFVLYRSFAQRVLSNCNSFNSDEPVLSSQNHWSEYKTCTFFKKMSLDHKNQLNLFVLTGNDPKSLTGLTNPLLTHILNPSVSTAGIYFLNTGNENLFY